MVLDGSPVFSSYNQYSPVFVLSRNNPNEFEKSMFSSSRTSTDVTGYRSNADSNDTLEILPPLYVNRPSVVASHSRSALSTAMSPTLKSAPELKGTGKLIFLKTSLSCALKQRYPFNPLVERYMPSFPSRTTFTSFRLIPSTPNVCMPMAGSI